MPNFEFNPAYLGLAVVGGFLGMIISAYANAGGFIVIASGIGTAGAVYLYLTLTDND